MTDTYWIIIVLAALGITISLIGKKASEERQAALDSGFVQMFCAAYPRQVPSSYYDVAPFLQTVDYLVLSFAVGDMSEVVLEMTVGSVIKDILDYKNWHKFGIDIKDYKYICSFKVIP